VVGVITMFRARHCVRSRRVGRRVARWSDINVNRGRKSPTVKFSKRDLALKMRFVAAPTCLLMYRLSRELITTIGCIVGHCICCLRTILMIKMLGLYFPQVSHPRCVCLLSKPSRPTPSSSYRVSSMRLPSGNVSSTLLCNIISAGP
jgi:hypothetical protein